MAKHALVSLATYRKSSGIFHPFSRSWSCILDNGCSFQVFSASTSNWKHSKKHYKCFFLNNKSHLRNVSSLSSEIFCVSYQKLWPHFVMCASSIVSKHIGLEEKYREKIGPNIWSQTVEHNRVFGTAVWKKFSVSKTLLWKGDGLGGGGQCDHAIAQLTSKLDGFAYQMKSSSMFSKLAPIPLYTGGCVRLRLLGFWTFLPDILARFKLQASGWILDLDLKEKFQTHGKGKKSP